MTAKFHKLTFPGSTGGQLAARLDMPAGPPKAFVLFAHCFTCSKDIFAASRIAGELTAHGFAVLRFDFTGLGASEGEFANTNFSSNVQDLIKAADYLRQNHMAPSILVGHSLGGAAVLAAAGDIPEARAVATIGAPSDAEHVVHNFSAHLDHIERDGEAEVTLAGREFTIRKQFLDDLRAQSVTARLGKLKKALLIFHAPLDNTVGIDNATAIFVAAKHPKSFVSLDTADHLLSRREDAAYVATVLSAWASRYLPVQTDSQAAEEVVPGAVMVTETGNGKFQQQVVAGMHRMLADEPVAAGGMDSGPSPYDFLSIALGACTAMTLRMYADHKKMPLTGVSVRVSHGKVHAKDCTDCGKERREGRIDRFERQLRVEGDLDGAARTKLLEIADKCPVHRTLEQSSVIVTHLHEPGKV
ncbi:MAG: alpha/beta fold hydrolase [Hyphomicrobiales bacterium]